MKARRFHSANKVYRLGGGTEDNDLWVLEEEGSDEVIGECTLITSVWELDEEERNMVAAGANIALTLVHAQVPVQVAVTSEPLGKGAG